MGPKRTTPPTNDGGVDEPAGSSSNSSLTVSAVHTDTNTGNNNLSTNEEEAIQYQKDCIAKAEVLKGNGRVMFKAAILALQDQGLITTDSDVGNMFTNGERFCALGFPTVSGDDTKVEIKIFKNTPEGGKEELPRVKITSSDEYTRWGQFFTALSAFWKDCKQSAALYKFATSTPWNKEKLQIVEPKIWSGSLADHLQWMVGQNTDSQRIVTIEFSLLQNNPIIVDNNEGASNKAREVVTQAKVATYINKGNKLSKQQAEQLIQELKQWQKQNENKLMNYHEVFPNQKEYLEHLTHIYNSMDGVKNTGEVNHVNDLPVEKFTNLMRHCLRQDEIKTPEGLLQKIKNHHLSNNWKQIDNVSEYGTAIFEIDNIKDSYPDINVDGRKMADTLMELFARYTKKFTTGESTSYWYYCNLKLWMEKQLEKNENYDYSSLKREFMRLAEHRQTSLVAIREQTQANPEAKRMDGDLNTLPKSEKRNKEPKKRDLTTMETTDKNTVEQYCRCCGKKGHQYNNCLLSRHPDANKNNSIDFWSSESGIKLLERYPQEKRGLTFFKRVDGTKVERSAYSKDQLTKIDALSKQKNKGEQNYNVLCTYPVVDLYKHLPNDEYCQPCCETEGKILPQSSRRKREEHCMGCEIKHYELMLVQETMIKTTPEAKRVKTSTMSKPTGQYADIASQLMPSYDETSGRIPARLRTLSSYPSASAASNNINGYIPSKYIHPSTFIPELTISAILDPQAGGNNSYVGEQTAAWLEQHGATRRKGQPVRIHSCLKKDDPPLCIEEMDVVLGVYDKRTNKVVDLVITCTVLPTEHELIISREHIQTFELLHHINEKAMNKYWERKPTHLERARDRPIERSQQILQVICEEQWKRDAEVDQAIFEKEGEDIASMIEQLELEATRQVRGNSYAFATNNEFLAAQADVLGKYKHVCRETLSIKPAKTEHMKLKINDEEWAKPANRTPHRLYSREKLTEIERQIQVMLASGVIRRSQARSHSHVLLTPKPNGKWRFCIDYRRLNEVTEPQGYPIPNIKELIQRLGAAKASCFATLDLTQGFYQTELHEDSRKYSAFVTQSGKYEWNRVPMGMRNSPHFFMEQMTEVLSGLLWTKCELYMDDLIVYGKTKEEYLTNLSEVLARLEERGLSVNPNKCKFGQKKVEFLGHVISEKTTTFSREKIQKVIDFDKPVFHKQMKSFLGLANYFRDHIKDHSLKVDPLNKMVRNYQRGMRLQWDEEATQAFETIKKDFNNLPALWFIEDDPVHDQEGNVVPTSIHLFTDASDIGMGAYVIQRVGEGSTAEERPIAFMSKSFTAAERRWTVTEREAYAIYAAVKKFDYLLLGRKFTVHTDHLNLCYIRDSVSSKVIRWKLALQEYDFTYKHIAGNDNTVADYLSRHVFASEKDEEIDLLLIYQQEIPNEQFNIIKQIHNKHMGHHGVQRTMKLLQERKHSWTNMRAHVTSFIRTCPCCQKMSFLKAPIETMGFTTSSKYCQARLSTDLIGPFPPDESGNTYCMIVIDNFSRFVELYPIKDSTAKSASKGLLSHFGRYGCPDELVTDNGSHFTADMTRELLAMMQVEHLTIAPYSHPQNAIAERAIKEINKHIRGILYEDKRVRSEWSVAVPMAQRIYNSAFNQHIGCSPAKIMFGNAVHLDRGLVTQSIERKGQSLTPLSKRMAEMLKVQHIVMERAKHLLNIHDEKHVQATESRVPTTFEIGSYVLLKPEVTSFGTGRTSRLDAINKGPLKVIAYQPNKGMYTVQNLVTNKARDIIPRRLKPYLITEESEKTIQSAALADDNQYLVEAVIGQRGSLKKNPNEVSFRIKWLNYDEEDNTWEPWSQLKTNLVVHEYLRKNNLSQFIPKKYRQTLNIN